MKAKLIRLVQKSDMSDKNWGWNVINTLPDPIEREILGSRLKNIERFYKHDNLNYKLELLTEIKFLF